MNNLYDWLLAISLIFTLSCNASASSYKVDSIANVPETLLKKAKGKIKGKFSFEDKTGKHALILTRDSTKTAEESDRIQLQATQYVMAKSSWAQEWTINDNLTCPGLDLDADFLVSLTSLTDLDSNGIIETTVAYQLACLGGIDPKPTKVIMRQGKSKFAARGESLIKLEGTAPFGGDFTLEPSLESSPAFKSHLSTIWKKAGNVIP